MEQDKKKPAPAPAPVSAPAPEAAKPQAAAPVAPPEPAKPVAVAEVPTAALPKPRFRLLSRETKIGAVVGASFLAVAGGIMGVKALLRETDTPPETPMVMQPPVGLEAPPAPSTTRFAPVEPPPPAPMPVTVPEVRVESPIMPARAEVVVTEEPKVSVPVAVPPPVDIPVIAAPPTEVRVPPKDESLVIPPPATESPVAVPPPVSAPPVVEAPAFKEPAITAPPPPSADDPFKANVPKPEAVQPPPPAADPLRPEAKNPVIRISANEPKKDVPPPVEPPPLIDVPSPMVKQEPPKIEFKPLEPAERKVPPAIEPPPVKVETPINIDPPVVKVKTPIKVEPPPQPKEEPAPIRIDSPAEPMRIDLSPRKENPPAFEQQPPRGGEVKKDGEYDEDLHSLRQNESYRSLSKQYYNSEAYAVALQRYNRENPGQADYVRVPPIWVLEKKYAADVSGGQARTVTFQQPAEAAAPRNEPVYTVGDNGEMLAEIARRQLGSEDSWKRIWELNPQINPAKSIPGGTRLKMPGQ